MSFGSASSHHLDSIPMMINHKHIRSLYPSLCHLDNAVLVKSCDNPHSRDNGKGKGTFSEPRARLQ